MLGEFLKSFNLEKYNFALVTLSFHKSDWLVLCYYFNCISGPRLLFVFAASSCRYSNIHIPTDNERVT